jgi:hypothetical protein
MKQFIAASLAAATTYAQFGQTTNQNQAATGEDGLPVQAGSSACLYCRNQDLNAGFLVSYSYCEHQDVCLKDAWNYIRRDCLSEWQRGNGLAMDDCSPEEVSCPSFTSSPELYQKYENTTWSMAAGSKCTVSVDATAGVARVIFSSTVYLGINYDAKIDEVITLESGVTDLEIYNAAESGPITFGISFSGAFNALVGSAATTAAIGAALLSF